MIKNSPSAGRRRSIRRLLILGICLWGAAACTQRRTDAQAPVLDCDFVPGLGEALPKCAYKSGDGHIVVRAEALTTASFGPEGLTWVVIGGATYFVNREGKTAPSYAYDNGADYFVEGLARTLKNGKVGFISPSLEEVIAPVWDFASPFSNGLAVVCQGCVFTPAFPDDEHPELKGGHWGWIDKRGRVVVPVVYERSDLPKRESIAR